jgi:hypothetical protein
MTRILPLICLLSVALSACAPRSPYRIAEPGGKADDALNALTKPDEYAWQLFFFLNRQALPGKAGWADPQLRFGQHNPDAPLVWETWALASGGPAKSEVFKEHGEKPVHWDQLNRNADFKLSLDKDLEIKLILLQQVKTLQNYAGGNVSKNKRKFTGTFPPEPATDDEEEVRINECAFNSIVSNDLYYIEGLQSKVADARKTGDRDFIGKKICRCSKLIKGEWLEISDADKPRYFWHSYGSKTYGLVAMHIATKDLRNWFWADFIHRDCEKQLGACWNKSLAAQTEPVDHTTRGPSGTGFCGSCGSNGIRSETRGTVWENYILRGTQTEYTTITGSKVVLTSPAIENQAQEHSCMSCHVYASVNSDGNYYTEAMTPIGPPEPTQFGDSGNTSVVSHTFRFLQTDFMWAVARNAQRRNSSGAARSQK